MNYQIFFYNFRGSIPLPSTNLFNMVTVYFEMTNWYCEKVATFDSEEMYYKCLPALEEECKKRGFDFITESID